MSGLSPLAAPRRKRRRAAARAYAVRRAAMGVHRRAAAATSPPRESDAAAAAARREAGQLDPDGQLDSAGDPIPVEVPDLLPGVGALGGGVADEEEEAKVDDAEGVLPPPDEDTPDVWAPSEPSAVTDDIRRKAEQLITDNARSHHAAATHAAWRTWANKLSWVLRQRNTKSNGWREGGTIPPRRMLRDQNTRQFFSVLWAEGKAPKSMRQAKAYINHCLKFYRFPIMSQM